MNSNFFFFEIIWRQLFENFLEISSIASLERLFIYDDKTTVYVIYK